MAGCSGTYASIWARIVESSSKVSLTSPITWRRWVFVLFTAARWNGETPFDSKGMNRHQSHCVQFLVSQYIPLSCRHPQNWCRYRSRLVKGYHGERQSIEEQQWRPRLWGLRQPLDGQLLWSLKWTCKWMLSKWWACTPCHILLAEAWSIATFMHSSHTASTENPSKFCFKGNGRANWSSPLAMA